METMYIYCQESKPVPTNTLNNINPGEILIHINASHMTLTIVLDIVSFIKIVASLTMGDTLCIDCRAVEHTLSLVIGV